MIPSLRETVAPYIKNMQTVQNVLFEFFTTEIERFFKEGSISPLIHNEANSLAFDVKYPLPKLKNEQQLFGDVMNLLRNDFLKSGWKGDDLYLLIRRDVDDSSSVLLSVKYNNFFTQYISDDEIKEIQK